MKTPKTKKTKPVAETDIDQFCQSVQNVITGIKYSHIKKTRAKKLKSKSSERHPANKAG